MISAAPVPHINSSARRGQRAVPTKMPRIGGYRLSIGTQRKLQSVMGAQRLRMPDRRIGALTTGSLIAAVGVPIAQFWFLPAHRGRRFHLASIHRSNRVFPGVST